MATLERQQAVHAILKQFHSLSALKQLVSSELSYDLVNKPLPRRTWTETAREALAADPVVVAEGGDKGAFHIVYAQLKGAGLPRGAERPVVTKLLEDHPYALFVFSNEAQDRWHFINVKHDEKGDKRRLFRRITVGADERLRTASERLALLDLESINPTLFGIAPLEIQKRHDDAFNVESVTKQFFNEYKAIYGILQNDLTAWTKDKRWAHDYALQFLNRCMFVYFIQRKRWLGDDTNFLHTFWQSYRKSEEAKNSFYERWLQVLFFEAFNNKKALFNSAQRKYLPEELREALWRAPYLNGGLFSENQLDHTSHRFNITDARFEQIFTFLERYNFTIAEDSPLDQEVAVDPEMIGKVYESLVNVSTEADERGDAGIFYTPRTEIDLMCRLALVDHLTNHVGDKHKNLLSELVFALEPHEKQMADTAAAEAGLWDALAERLREVTALDPACGSGSFLVGMLHVLDDLQCRVAGQTGARESAYERKKRIIGQSLYGVDVMDWAAHVAELRMWLALIIDAEFTQEELWNRNEPLLPHFSFKIRTGDSLVQEIGGLSLANPRNLRGQVSPALKARVTKLKNEKLKFYHNDPTRKFNSMRELEQEELNLFRDLIDDHRAHLESEIHRLEKAIEQPAAEQIELLTGDVKRQARQMSLKELENLKQLEAARANLERVQTARQSLKTAKDVPFVWDIAFVEVFADERGGFDLVIGNPPYVRQESIADPHLPREKVTTENKKAYKLKLQRAVYEAFPQFFGFNQKTGTARHKLDAKSDLYIYFYFLSLPLLNLKGAFCFITSNSWLDVGYGADLQEFLLRRCHVKLVIDNAAKRSFESADVNTVITLLSPPTAKMHADDATNPCLEQTARFVMFKTGFENALSPVLFEEIEEAAERKQTPEFRVFPISQRQLLTDGMEAPSDTDEVVPTRGTTKRGKAGAPLVKAPQYNGNKWGGKYLRAPEIYWTVIEKGRNYLSRFSDVASVRFGLKSGANEFFYLDDEKQVNWRIEKQYLGNRILFSLKEVRSIADPMEQLRYRFFKCYKPKSELRGTRALKYIEWGEEQGFHLRPSCQSRRLWYSIGNNWKPAPLIFPAKVGERMVVVENEAGIIEDKKLYGVTPLEGIEVPALAASLNSTWTRLYMDLTCSQLTGAQAIADINVEVVEALMIPNPELFKSKEAKSAYNAMRKRPICPRVADEIKQADRREVDDALFKVIRLTAKESEAVYEAVETLVRERLAKADSLKPKDRVSKRLEAVERTQGIWRDVPDFEEIEA